MKRLTLQEQNKLFLESVLQKKAIYGVPKGLANEIVKKIPKEKFHSNTDTFCDIAAASPEFVISICNRLNSYNQETDFTNRVFAITQYTSVANMIEQELEKKGYKITIKVIKNILEEDLNMKFDVVVGNPPYQDSNKKGSYNALWPKFVEKSRYLRSNNGIVAMVSPSTWFTQPRINKGNLISKISSYIVCEAIVISTDQVKNHFAGLGSTFSYYILADNPTEKCFLNGVEIKRSEILESLQSFDEKVIRKLQSFKCFQKENRASGGKNLANSPNDLCKFKTLISHNKIMYADKPSLFHGKKKAIFLVRTSFDYPVLDYYGDINAPPGSTSAVYIFNSIEEVKNFGELFKTTLYKFLIKKQRKHHGFLSMLTVSKIPKVDLSKSWTDEELYKHFNLTQEEIDYIESNVK